MTTHVGGGCEISAWRQAVALIDDGIAQVDDDHARTVLLQGALISARDKIVELFNRLAEAEALLATQRSTIEIQNTILLRAGIREPDPEVDTRH